MLKTERAKFHIVKEGQTLQEIAAYFSVSPWLLAEENGLNAPPHVGQVLKIPQEKGNAYVVRAGDKKALLCGCDENFRRRNGTEVFYIGMRVIL